MSDVWYKGFERPNLDMLKEGQLSGALSGRLAQLFALVNEDEHMARAPISIDPGDFAFIGGDNSPGMALSLPIAYDVWYLWHTVNIIEDQDNQEEFIRLVILPLFGDRGVPRPLRTINKKATGSGIVPDLSFFQAKGISYIKEMRFETFLHGRSPLYDSPGPSWMSAQGQDLEGRGIGDIYAGYLSFPVGPLGVMRVVSLVSESLLARPEYQVADDSEKPVPGEQLLPPMERQSNSCSGRHLVEDTYSILNRDTEYPAKDMAGTENTLPHHWMRYWLKKEDTFPVPGEFLAMLTKAQGLPPHCWWYQETNPILYSGNFFETEYYTSGIVLAVIKEVDRDWEAGTATYEVAQVSVLHEQRQGHGEYCLQEGMQFTWEEVGNVYKIKVKDQDLYLKSSDFLEYRVNDRVAVRKVPGVWAENFIWEDLEPGRRVPGTGVYGRMEYDMAMAGKPFEINRQWVVVPITFYKGVSS